MLHQDNIKTILFAILSICFAFYIFLGTYNYRRDKKLKVNITFFFLCIATSLWALGYAFMLISPNIEIANSWRIVAALGWCFFNGIWLSFTLSLKDSNQKSSVLKIQFLIHIISLTFFISNLIFEPSKIISSQAYGFVDDLYASTTIGIIFSFYSAALFIAGIFIIYFQMRNSHKNRIKKQMKVIFISGVISFCLVALSDLILPALGIVVFPSGVIASSIGMSGLWYAINKHKMLSISPELVSEYLFEAINEPIFILDEDFLVKNCNKASLNITGYISMDIEHNSIDTIINFRNFNFNSIMKAGNVVNIEVDLHRVNKETLICELSANVIYDEYEDILGIVALLHDVSERKSIVELQNKNAVKLEESNLKLKTEIIDRIYAEDQLLHFVYFDALTELPNRKKCWKRLMNY